MTNLYESNLCNLKIATTHLLKLLLLLFCLLHAPQMILTLVQCAHFRMYPNLLQFLAHEFPTLTYVVAAFLLILSLPCLYTS